MHFVVGAATLEIRENRMESMHAGQYPPGEGGSALNGVGYIYITCFQGPAYLNRIRVFN